MEEERPSKHTPLWSILKPPEGAGFAEILPFPSAAALRGEMIRNENTIGKKPLWSLQS